MEVNTNLYFNENCIVFTEKQKEKLKEKDAEMQSLLKQMETDREMQAEREKRLACEKKEAEKNRAKQKKLMQLNSEIAYYRSRLMMNPEDKIARGQLAMAKCKRYWTMYG